MPARPTVAAPCQRNNAGLTSNRNVTKRRNRIAGQTEQKFFTVAAKDKRTARFDRHFPKLQMAAEFFERAFHEIHFTDRDAAAGDHDVALGKGA